MDVGGWGRGGACDVSRGKIVENFDSLMNIFNIFKSSTKSSIFISVYIFSKYVCSLSAPGFASSVLLYFYTFILLYTSILKPAR